jgi:DNA-binding GntR family transcriptional regulator
MANSTRYRRQKKPRVSPGHISTLHRLYFFISLTPTCFHNRVDGQSNTERTKYNVQSNPTKASRVSRAPPRRQKSAEALHLTDTASLIRTASVSAAFLHKK